MACYLDEAKADLGALSARFESCIRGALNDYTTLYAALRHKHSKRTQASIIHDLMVARFTEEFGEAERGVASDVAVHSKGNLRLIIAADGKYKIKMKKLDGNLAAKNIPTQAAIRFVQQLSFAQVPAPTNLFIGYQVANDAELAASKVWITCPAGNDIGWEWELTHSSDEADVKRQVAELPKFNEFVEEPTPKKRRASLKKELVAKLFEKIDGTADKSE